MRNQGVRYEISKRVCEEAKVLGFSEPVLPLLKKMVVQSSPITHPNGQRRYEDYIFAVHNGVVCSIKVMVSQPNRNQDFFKCKECEDTEKITVYEVCDSCSGSGCDWCSGKGEIIRKIDCQRCVSHKHLHISTNAQLF